MICKNCKPRTSKVFLEYYGKETELCPVHALTDRLATELRSYVARHATVIPEILREYDAAKERE